MSSELIATFLGCACSKIWVDNYWVIFYVFEVFVIFCSYYFLMLNIVVEKTDIRLKFSHLKMFQLYFLATQRIFSWHNKYNNITSIHLIVIYTVCLCFHRFSSSFTSKNFSFNLYFNILCILLSDFHIYHFIQSILLYFIIFFYLFQYTYVL